MEWRIFLGKSNKQCVVPKPSRRWDRIFVASKDGSGGPPTTESHLYPPTSSRSQFTFCVWSTKPILLHLSGLLFTVLIGQRRWLDYRRIGIIHSFLVWLVHLIQSLADLPTRRNRSHLKCWKLLSKQEWQISVFLFLIQEWSLLV